MPSTAHSIEVEGEVRTGPNGPAFVLSNRLEGHDTFLTGHLSLDGETIRVRIFTLDDVTVLRPVEATLPGESGVLLQATLQLPHGLNLNSVPEDLLSAAADLGRRLDTLDTAELRYALTFLGEASTEQIRRIRVEAIASALPPKVGNEATSVKMSGGSQ